jgi:SPP1 family predicted phage head-tail adaptor
MNSGKLKHWILLEEFVSEIDSDGITTESWVEQANPIPAEVSDLSGRELVAAQAVASKVSTRIRIRQRTVEPSWRVRYAGRLYNIEAVTEDADTRTKWTTLHCTSGVNEG